MIVIALIVEILLLGVIAGLLIVAGLRDDSDDPIKHCEVYIDHGCSHVDGFLCDIKTCPILQEHLRS